MPNNIRTHRRVFQTLLNFSREMHFTFIDGILRKRDRLQHILLLLSQGDSDIKGMRAVGQTAAGKRRRRGLFVHAPAKRRPRSVSRLGNSREERVSAISKG